MAIGTIAGLRSYADARGVITPALSIDTLAQQALTRGNDYIEAHYLNRFYDPSMAVQTPVEAAVYEAALLELDTPGFFTKVYTPGERKVLTEVKGIRWTLLDDAGASPSPISTRIESLLAPYLRGGLVALVV